MLPALLLLLLLVLEELATATRSRGTGSATRSANGSATATRLLLLLLMASSLLLFNSGVPLPTRAHDSGESRLSSSESPPGESIYFLLYKESLMNSLMNSSVLVAPTPYALYVYLCSNR